MPMPFKKTFRRPAFKRVILPFTIGLLVLLGAMTMIAGT